MLKPNHNSCIQYCPRLGLIPQGWGKKTKLRDWDNEVRYGGCVSPTGSLLPSSRSYSKHRTLYWKYTLLILKIVDLAISQARQYSWNHEVHSCIIPVRQVCGERCGLSRKIWPSQHRSAYTFPRGCDGGYQNPPIREHVSLHLSISQMIDSTLHWDSADVQYESLEGWHGPEVSSNMKLWHSGEFQYTSWKHH